MRMAAKPTVWRSLSSCIGVRQKYVLGIVFCTDQIGCQAEQEIAVGREENGESNDAEFDYS